MYALIVVELFQCRILFGLRIFEMKTVHLSSCPFQAPGILVCSQTTYTAVSSSTLHTCIRWYKSTNSTEMSRWSCWWRSTGTHIVWRIFVCHMLLFNQCCKTLLEAVFEMITSILLFLSATWLWTLCVHWLLKFRSFLAHFEVSMRVILEVVLF